MRFTEPLPPLSPRQRSIFWILAIFCAASRFASMARSLWDWDEALFCLGMRSYDVTLHHPHPPGFPVYIALGRLVRVLVGDDFRSLQTLNLTAGFLLFPAVFMLARELRLPFATSTIAAALCAFFPNVWFYGGTAFSDIPSITLVVFGVALLFRGCRDAEAYLLGVFLVALAVGIRPQNAMVAIFPLAISTRYRAPRDVAFGAMIGGVTILAAFGGAIAATGSYQAFMTAIRAHSDYITRVDSFRSALRPPLWRLVALFFAKQYSSPALNIIMTILVIISIAGRNRAMLYNALTFGPVAIAAWLMLDRYSVNRFSIGYCPMFAIFAADGIARLAAYVEPALSRFAPAESRRYVIEAAIGALLIGAFVLYTLPALAPVRDEVAPSVMAVQAARAHFDPHNDDLFVASDMSPFVDYFMPGARFIRVLDERAMVLSSGSRPPHLIAEIIATSPEGFVFHRARGRLWNIARRHYFAAGYATVTRFPQFVSGWYAAERSGEDEWRWMAARSITTLPPSKGDTLLRLGLIADSPARATVTVNGKAVEAFPLSGQVLREWHVTPAANGEVNTLEITTNRDRAVRVRFLSWAPY